MEVIGYAGQRGPKTATDFLTQESFAAAQSVVR
jgi:hypothetical protein